MRTFTPEPWTAGSRVTWTHFAAHGRETIRTGTVWDLAPTLHGGKSVWVIPDTRDEADPYPPAVVVVLAPATRKLGTPLAWRRSARKGEAFSEADDLTPTGSLAAGAARLARRARQGLAA